MESAFAATPHETLLLAKKKSLQHHRNQFGAHVEHAAKSTPNVLRLLCFLHTPPVEETFKSSESAMHVLLQQAAQIRVMGVRLKKNPKPWPYAWHHCRKLQAASFQKEGQHPPTQICKACKKRKTPPALPPYHVQATITVRTQLQPPYRKIYTGQICSKACIGGGRSSNHGVGGQGRKGGGIFAMTFLKKCN